MQANFSQRFPRIAVGLLILFVVAVTILALAGAIYPGGLTGGGGSSLIGFVP